MYQTIWRVNYFIKDDSGIIFTGQSTHTKPEDAATEKRIYDSMNKDNTRLAKLAGPYLVKAAKS